MKKFPINKTNIIIPILTICLMCLALLGFIYRDALNSVRMGSNPYKYSEGKEDEFFPYSEEEAKAIEESEPIKEGETWAIYWYINGSNLELNGHSQLSDFVEWTVGQEVEAAKEVEKEAKKERITEFVSTEESKGVPIPLTFYNADYVKSNAAGLPEENREISDGAWGSEILDKIKSADLPENYTVVVQPGGATAWRNEQVNPNRTRRFVKNGNELKEVYDAPVSNMADPQTLADFLIFAKENYPADHTMVILTDHGGAMNGFGWDYVYGGDDRLTLRELTEAFDKAYGVDEEKPPVDLLYFNACLMSNTDVINAMRGVTKYMVAGEEVGWTLTDYIETLAEKIKENPDANAMQLGKYIVDSYVTNVTEAGAIKGSPNTTSMGVLDVKKAAIVSDTYMMFARNILENVADNPQLLLECSKAVSSSISFALDSYKGYNVTDLGLWVDGLKETYPKESAKIIELVDDAVIYKRADNYLKDAYGISVYFPNYVETTSSLNVALDYIDNISYSDDISALYYYKLAGCLNDKYAAYCKAQGIKIPKTINYAALSKLRNYELSAADDAGNFTGTVPEAADSIIRDVRYELCKVNEDDDTVTYYGEDRYVNPDLSNGIETDFEGKWVTIGGKRFAVNVINVVDNYILYESPVMYHDFEYKLVIRCEVSGENREISYTIEGLRTPYESMATADRNLTELQPGSYITPIYQTSNINGGEMKAINGPSVLYNINTSICDGELESGKYRARIVFEDMRGDDAYSAPIFFEVE